MGGAVLQLGNWGSCRETCVSRVVGTQGACENSHLLVANVPSTGLWECGCAARNPLYHDQPRGTAVLRRPRQRPIGGFFEPHTEDPRRRRLESSGILLQSCKTAPRRPEHLRMGSGGPITAVAPRSTAALRATLCRMAGTSASVVEYRASPVHGSCLLQKRGVLGSDTPPQIARGKDAPPAQPPKHLSNPINPPSPLQERLVSLHGRLLCGSTWSVWRGSPPSLARNTT